LLALVGFVTRSTQLYGIARYTGIAPHTAFAILLLALGLFFARAEWEPASIFVVDNPGGEVARTMLPVAILLPLCLGWLRETGQRLRLFDVAFGRAALLLSLMVVFTIMVWRVARRLSTLANARHLAELASYRARAEAQRLAATNLQTLNVLDALLAHAPVGLVFLDRERNCIRINDFLLQNLPTARHGASQRTLAELLDGTHPALDAAIERVFEFGVSTINVELNVSVEHDDDRSWLAGVFPVQDDASRPSICGAVLMEITERKRLEAQRATLLDSERAARVEAERAALLKDQFLATLSHELRTPLNAILGWARLLRKSVGKLPELERPVEVIERNARLQAKLIEDLLDVSRIVSGKMRIANEPISMSGVVHAALTAALPNADSKHVNIAASIPEDLPQVSGDASRLQQAVTNLLANAIKFSHEHGQVRVELRKQGNYIDFSVSDDGIGISEEFLPHLFDRFRQADASTTRRHGGLGLGLTIVKQLAELHGGSVRASSPGLQRGATFVLSLPIIEDETAPLSTELACAVLSDTVLSDVRVLVVDDEPDSREFIGRVLRDARASVELVSSVEEALAKLSLDSDYVLVSDIGMPGRDGYDLIRSVRQKYAPEAVPAIAVTAFARVEDRDRALDAGFQIHLAKPVDPYEMTRAVAKLRGRSSRPIIETGAPPAETP
jgi:signal transduction histidine kinase/CheY-like chemotaxis protein